MGEWEQDASVLVDLSKRGNGRCFWFGCEEPGFIRATWRVPTPVTLHPDHKFCPKHALQAKQELAEATRRTTAWVAAGMPKPSGWEPDGRSRVRRRANRLADIMRDKRIAERQSLHERDGHRQEYLRSVRKP